MKPRDIPNAISIARIFLVIPLIALLAARDFAMALLVFCIAGISDGVDGYLARHYKWISRLGGILDPIGDKVLLVVSFIMLAWLNVIPVWLTVLVIIRDVVIVTGAVAYHYIVGYYDMAPSWISKVNTFMQLALVVLVLAAESVYPMDEGIIAFAIALVALTTASSGINYVWVWGRQAWQETHK